MPIALESSSSMRYNHVMRRTSRWLCTTLRVPTSAQGNTRAVNEFPVPPVFFLVLQCGLIFFTLISLVPWQNWAILSYSVDPWKKPRAEIWNAKQIMRFLSSLPFFFEILFAWAMPDAACLEASQLMLPGATISVWRCNAADQHVSSGQLTGGGSIYQYLFPSCS